MVLLKLILALLGTALLALLVLGAVVLLHAPRAKPRWLLATAGAHGVLLTLALLLWFNARPGFFDDNQLAFDLTSDLRQMGRMPDPLGDQDIGFVLVDNSANKATTTPHDATEAGQQKVAITDRALLARVLAFLGAHQEKIGLVVCDIVFEDSSAHDGALATAVRTLAGHDKIVLAQGVRDNTPRLRFGPRVMGRATEPLQGKLIAAHHLFLDGKPGIPCLMYEHTTGARLRPAFEGLFLREQNGPRHRLAYPAFPAALDRFDERLTRLPASPGGEGHTADPPYLPLSLGYAASPAGQEDLLAKVQEQGADRSKRLPIVMIGEFGPPLGERAGSDVHHTFHGPMQGSVILIDLYLEMLGGAHTVPWFSVGIVLLLLTVLSLHVFGRPWGVKARDLLNKRFWTTKEFAPVAPDAPRRLGVGASSMPAVRSALWRSLCGLLKKGGNDVLPVAIFLLVFVLLDRFARIRMNLAAFLLYFLLLHALFKKLDLSLPASKKP